MNKCAVKFYQTLDGIYKNVKDCEFYKLLNESEEFYLKETMENRSNDVNHEKDNLK